MKNTSIIIFSVFLLFCAFTLLRAAGNHDLPSNAPLRIGVTKRVEDCKRKSKKGDFLSMHYVGSLRKDGKVFDSSRERDSPFEFTVGAGQVIQGWDKGLIGMCIGERRKLTIPSDLGYGDHGAPPNIPPKATLVFEVELLDIKDKKNVHSEF